MTSRRAELLVALGLGSNLPLPGTLAGDGRRAALERAVADLERAGWKVLRTSHLYETAPVGVTADHGRYLNAVALVCATGEQAPSAVSRDAAARLRELLETCEGIERSHGRTGKGELTRRVLDLDLLAAWRGNPSEAEDEWLPVPPLSSSSLTVPHPRLPERAFVVAPLAELLPRAPLTLAGGERRTPAGLLESLRSGGGGDLGGIQAGPRSASFPLGEAPA